MLTRGRTMSFLASYEGPDSGEYEQSKLPSYSCSMSWPSSGPSAHEVPMSSICKESTKQDESPAQKQKETDVASAHSRPCKNPMPVTGSRRDACGCWSPGSEGHEFGRCNGPCKDVRSGLGCTWGKKCKKCHMPHPEVSSSSIRSKKTRGRQMLEQVHASGLDREQQVQYLFGGYHRDISLQQQEDETDQTYEENLYPNGVSISL
eukprot:TRINITY_DN1536_c0_g1_i10.p1 TRINITY_DN1536_c0_g1~~TRINITY_DN1536_c0_g1_i10.p1  ORF type:complete len:230 (-),score=15.32 TRINITY_DN1536_c0_g1_i10:235-849(-)